MKKILIISTIIAILGGGIWLLAVNRTNLPSEIKLDELSEVEEVEQSKVVVMNDEDQNYCQENRLPKAAEGLVVGQEYGQFTYLGYEQGKVSEYEDGCNVRGVMNFSGEATVSGTYLRSDMGEGGGMFTIFESDQIKFPEITEENDFTLHDYVNKSFEVLFKYSSDEVYGEIGTSTIKISGLRYGYFIEEGKRTDGVMYKAEGLGAGLSTTLIEILENENEIAPYGYFIKDR